MPKIEFMHLGEIKMVIRYVIKYTNNKGVDCKMIGPETKCFCDHRYKEHNHLEP